MHIFIISLIILLVAYFIFTLATVITLYPNYKNYKLTYNSLVKGEQPFNYSYGGLYYFSSNVEESSYFNQEVVIFFEEDKDIKLLGYNSYIHNCFNMVDPYTYYWHRKLWKWFNDNKINFKNK